MVILRNFSPYVAASMSWAIMAEGHAEKVDGTVGSMGLSGTIWGEIYSRANPHNYDCNLTKNYNYGQFRIISYYFMPKASPNQIAW